MAKRGRKDAQAKLEGPGFPERLAYLWRWFEELEQSREMGPHGLQPLTYVQIDAWARLTDRQPEPHETRLLMTLDAVMRFPDAKD